MGSELYPDDQLMVERAKQLLDRSLSDLHPDVARRLQRARIDILATEPRPRWRPAWVVGTAMAALAMWVVLLWMKQPASDPPHQAASFEDMDLVLSAENVDLADDLEFYHWLADVDRTG